MREASASTQSPSIIVAGEDIIDEDLQNILRVQNWVGLNRTHSIMHIGLSLHQQIELRTTGTIMFQGSIYIPRDVLDVEWFARVGLEAGQEADLLMVSDTGSASMTQVSTDIVSSIVPTETLGVGWQDVTISANLTTGTAFLTQMGLTTRAIPLAAAPTP